MNGVEQLPAWAAVLTAVLLFLGAAVTLIGSLGLIRLGSFYERVHAPTLGTTFGTGFDCARVDSLFLGPADPTGAARGPDRRLCYPDDTGHSDDTRSCRAVSRYVRKPGPGFRTGWPMMSSNRKRPASNPDASACLIAVLEGWHNQDIDVQRTQHLLRDAPEKQFQQPGAAPGSHHQQIGSYLFDGA